MYSRKENDQLPRSSPPYDLESPFLEAELFAEESDAEWESHLAALEAESLFRHAFEQDQTIFSESEKLKGKLLEDAEVPDDGESIVDAVETQDEETTPGQEKNIEAFYGENEVLCTEEKEEAFSDDAAFWEEEPLILEEYVRELEEEPSPAPDLRSRIVDVAKREWEAWKKGNLLENNPNARPLLFNYWMNYKPGGANPKTTNSMVENRVAWSAVFISYVMRTAGAGQAFAYAPLHTTYITAAKKAAENQDASKFRAYHISSAKPEVGDLVCRDRAPEKRSPCAGTSLANVDKGGISHCDIVVEVQPKHIVILGGNTGQAFPERGLKENTVGQRRIRLDEQGLIIPEQSKGACKYFAILKPPGKRVTSSTPVEPPITEPLPEPVRPPVELVRFAQQVLNVTEGERLAVDGILGHLTSGALERFRGKYNLGVGGALDGKTQLALAQRALEESRRQSLFGQFGVLDAATRQELIAFKSEHGLRADDKLDAVTRTALANSLVQSEAIPRGEGSDQFA